MKNFGQKGAWAYPGTSHIFFGTPYYLRNGETYIYQIWPVHSEGPSEQKPIKNCREKGAWAYSGTVQIFWAVPEYVISYSKKRISSSSVTFPVLRNGESYRFQIWPVHSEGPCE